MLRRQLFSGHAAGIAQEGDIVRVKMAIEVVLAQVHMGVVSASGLEKRRDTLNVR